jgi:hypothetical protein
MRKILVVITTKRVSDVGRWAEIFVKPAKSDQGHGPGLRIGCIGFCIA